MLVRRAPVGEDGTKEEEVWLVATPPSELVRAVTYLFPAGAAGTSTTLIRGWLRKGCWPNSTSLSDRLP